MIDRPFARLSATRALTLAALAPLSQAQLDFSPRPGRWSVGEVADHVRLAETLYRGEIAELIALARAGRRPHIRRSFDDVNVAPLFLPNEVLSMFQAPLAMMSRMIPSAVRSAVTRFPLIPTRNPDAATPRRGRPAAELREALERSLRQTGELLAANRDLDFSVMISEHPLTGASTVPQILEFLAQHEERHQGQMERVRSDSRFPPA